MTSIEDLNLIDSICDEFESGLRTMSRPNLADFLFRLPSRLRYQALEEFRAIQEDFAMGQRSAGAKKFPSASLSEFHTEEIAGRGSTCTVYRARHIGSGKRVALKVFHVRNVLHVDSESTILGVVKHPAFPRLLFVDTSSNRKFIAMEFINGTPLQTLLRKSKLSPANAIAILALIADAVSSLHMTGQTHGDLKPSHLMLTDSGSRIRIIDLGSTRHSRDFDVSNIVEGTPFYMSPEQKRGRKIGDFRSDIYSLGAILVELICGERWRIPKGGQYTRGYILSQLHVGLEFVANLDTRRMSIIRELCMRCLANDPDHRFQSCRELFRFASDATNSLAEITELDVNLARQLAERKASYEEISVQESFVDGFFSSGNSL